MPPIIVDDAQAKIISESSERIEIRDRRGRHLGYVASRFTADDVAIAKRRMESRSPRYTTLRPEEASHCGANCGCNAETN